jgi:hypothetical protein
LSWWDRVPGPESSLTTRVSRLNLRSIWRAGGAKTIGTRCASTWASRECGGSVPKTCEVSAPACTPARENRELLTHYLCNFSRKALRQPPAARQA